MPIHTNVTTESIDVSDMFPVAPEEKENTLFQKNSEAINIDKEEDSNLDIDESRGNKKVTTKEPIVSHETPSLEEIENSTEQFEEAKAGTHADLVSFFKPKLESKEIIPFDDFDESKQSIEDYLKTFKTKDWDDLWKANLTLKEEDLAKRMPGEFFGSLPEEFQYAARYWQDGGTDLKSIFKALGQVEEIKELDPVNDSRKVNETYLSAIKFGTPEEIKEQLDQWDDLNVSQKKAEGFKPKLDKMQEQILEQKLAAQANLKQEQKNAYDFYHNNVVDAISDSDLGGIQIDKKVQAALYSGLTQHSFKDSRGKVCTEFEYLLDQIMWVKPDYKKLAKIQWMLKDEPALQKAYSTKAVNNNVEDTVRTLKTEQSKKTSAQIDSPENQTKRTIPRESGLFKRR